ncbi:MAG: hypothetical protein ACJ78Q_08875, partial [Chloroflexia bacterium]
MIRHVGLQGRLVGWIGIGAMGLLLGLALFYGGAVASGSRAQGTSQESARAEIAGAGRLAERLSRYDPLPTWTPLACGTHSNYAITQSAGAAIVAGTALVPGSQGDNVMTVITLPFRYYLYGAGLDQMNADSNGKLQVSVVNSSQPDNICLPDANQAWAILPYWDDLDTSASIPSSLGPLGIYTSVSG